MAINPARMRELLQEFRFRQLFIEELGWSLPPGNAVVPFICGDAAFTRRPIAQLGGVVVFEIAADDGAIPDKETCAAVHREIAKQYHENLLIFVDKERTQSLWYWVKRDGTKRYPRPHLYVVGQPGDLFLSKIVAMFVDISEFGPDGNLTITEAADRLRKALDVELTTKKFYEEYQREHLRFIEHIRGIADDRDRRWYASVLLNRLMFIYFLQRKGWLDNGAVSYLQEKLAKSKERGPDRYYAEFLRPLFFEAFAVPEGERSAATNALVGKVRYLSGSIFLPHPIEERWGETIAIDDAAFDDLFTLFTRFSWNLDDTPGASDDEINPDVLGYIFEKYINQKAFGAYYTRTEITDYLCERTIHRVILDKINPPDLPEGGRFVGEGGRFANRPYGTPPSLRGKGVGGLGPSRHFETMNDLLTNLDASLCRQLLYDILPNLSILDPACGSGAFLVAAMKALIPIYTAVTGKIPYLKDAALHDWLHKVNREHPSLPYYVKKRIISDNLFGVDIMEEAAEIAQLRLYLALVSSVRTEDQLEPLPNIDFNLLTGNSLIGLLKVNETEYNPRLGEQPYREVVREKNVMIAEYRRYSGPSVDLRLLRNAIQAHRDVAAVNLNAALLSQWNALGIKYEQATWDAAKNKEGKPAKRALTVEDIAALHPFHWGYEFDQVLNERGGFDVIITNPPWETVKPYAKEFFAQFSALVTTNTMTIKEFEEHQAEALRDADVLQGWLAYTSQYPHQSMYFRSAKQYANQISVVNGKKAGTDINLYKLFTEQCFNLLRPGGQCGIVIPSGIYTDLGTKQLREMLFSQTQVTGLFGFENRRMIFDNVDSRFKFIVLTYEKGGTTETFPAAFMRHDVTELNHFPAEDTLILSVELIRHLSPDSLSIMEVKDETDVRIAEKMLQYPLLSERIEGAWNLALTREFDMTNDSNLFHTTLGPDRLPLYEGKMIHQFTSQWAQPRYWLDEQEARTDLLRTRLAKVIKVARDAKLDTEIDPSSVRLDYESYRIAFRDVARNTDERTMILTILPPRVFCPHTISLEAVFSDKVLDRHVVQNVMSLPLPSKLYVAAAMNSFVVDYAIRTSVTAHVSFFFVYNLHVPRLTEKDAAFRPIVERAARLICTTPEFDDLARAVGLRGHEDGATDPAERARLRAELDGMVAHLYGLTDDEFAHILGTFPLVPQATKDAALDAYRAQAPKPGDPVIADLIARGESKSLEFKQSVCWDETGGKRGEKVIVKSVAAFLNSEGGTLLIGVKDDGTIAGLADDYQKMSDKMGKDRDGYERFLTQLLLAAYGSDAIAFIDLSFHVVDGNDVCRITVKPATKPVWVKEGATHVFYVRTGNASRALDMPDAYDYARSHWP